VKYIISDLLDLNIQYKVLWADYESGTEGQKGYFAYDVTTYGPIIGLNFKCFSKDLSFGRLCNLYVDLTDGDHCIEFNYQFSL